MKNDCRQRASIVLVACITVLSLGLSSCSKNRPGDVASTAKSNFLYPHPEDWHARHVESYSNTSSASVASADKATRSCSGCHDSRAKARALSQSVSCGMRCHGEKPSMDPGHETGTAPPTRPVRNNECASCHGGMAAGKTYAHYPFAAGICGTCHEAQPAHLGGTDHKAVSTVPVPESCYRCHFRKDSMPEKHAALGTEKSCLLCHDPHGSENRKFLVQPVKQLCLSCHDGVKHEGKSIHGIINDQASCVNCHNPHSAGHKPLLRKQRRELCLSCHDKEIQTSGSSPRTIPSIKKKIEDTYVHYPAAGKTCISACHSPHAAGFDRLLLDAFPVSNYNRYVEEPNTYALCFGCHDVSMLNATGSAGDTNFRNDTMKDGVVQSKNLHWFHVVDAAGSGNKEMGRNCVVCHDPHGAPQEHNIRSSWKMGHSNVNLKYVPNPKGGQCMRSCHESKTYERIDR